MQSEKKVPMRTCIGCGANRPKKELVRIVHQADGSFHIDRSGRMNGRGAYVCNDPACLQKAFDRKALQRSFQMNVDRLVQQQLKEEFECHE